MGSGQSAGRDAASQDAKRSGVPRLRAVKGSVSIAAAVALTLTPTLSMAQQLPTGGSVAAGSATISSPNSSTLNVNQSSNRAVINWSDFSVGAGGTVNFNQPGTTSATLNRVTGSMPSSIAGTINAPGTVMLVNPNGIAITKNGIVNVGSFAASTLDINNDDFMSGNYKFSGNGASAGVTNAGRINVADGGFAALLGGRVANDGVISARLGKVGLGSGELMTLDLSGDGFLSVAVPTLNGIVDASGKPLVSNKGKIRADGGVVYLSAATAAGLLRDAVHVPGSIRANSVGTRDGKIVIGGGGGGKVTVSGKVKANGNATAKGGKIDISGAQVAGAGKVKANGSEGGTIKVTADAAANIDGEISAKGSTGKGGTVIVSADAITVGGAAKLDVSGATGGLLLIGGDYQGGVNAANNFSIEQIDTALTTTIAAGATLSAAGTNGDGGKVVVWSDDVTQFAGHVDVGSTGGKGGFAEVSGHRLLDFTGTASLAGTTGAGTLLLDPRNVVISSGTDSGGAIASGTYTPSADDSILNVTTLLTALASGNVVVTTGSSGSQAGDITVVDAVTWSSGNSLTLTAAHDVNINAAITGRSGGLIIAATNAATATAAIDVGSFTLQSGAWSQNTGTLPGFAATNFTISGGSFLRVAGGDGSSGTPYQIVDVYGLQGIGTSAALLSKAYRLANDIDASGTANWNAGLGFSPIGRGLGFFAGSLDGGGNAIRGLTINRPGSIDTGLIASVSSGGTISNLFLIGGSVSGGLNTGALVGRIASSSAPASITNVHSDVQVVGDSRTGGLVGSAISSGTGAVVITKSSSTGNVTANDSSLPAGGLVGGTTSSGGSVTISDSYATGAVFGTAGGLVGNLAAGSVITGSWASGPVSGATSGGLVGTNSGTVSNSYWDTTTTGKSVGFGTNTGTFTATGLTSTQARTQASYGGFDFANTWYMVNGETRPFLRGEYSTTIRNAHQLQLIGMNATTLAASYTLANDINLGAALSNTSDMWGSAGWVPIGTDGAGGVTAGTGFAGTLDGQYHFVDGMTINRPGAVNVGLIGYQTAGAISKIGLTNVNVIGSHRTGSLAGWMLGGSVSDSFATGTVSGGWQVGGLVGQMQENTSLLRTYAQVYVTGTGGDVGGLVGQSAAAISQSYAAGRVTGTSASGLTFNNGGTVTSSYYDTLMFGGSSGAGTGYVTAQMQSALGSFDSTYWSVVSGQSYFYLKGFYPTAPQVISGTAYTGYFGTPAASGASGAVIVSALVNGTNVGNAATGANGYYNLLVAPNTIVADSQVAAYTTGATGGVAYRQDVAAGSVTGLNIFGTYLTETSAATTLSAVSAGLATAIGSTGVSTTFANRFINLTGTSFLIDEAINLSGILRLSTTGDLSQTAGASGAFNVNTLLIGRNGTGSPIVTLTNTGNVFANLGSANLGSGTLSLYDSVNLLVGGTTAHGGVLIQTAGNLTVSNTLSSSASGDAIVLVAGGNFANGMGASALSTPNGRWLVYAGTPTGSSFNALNSNNAAIFNSTYANNAPSTIASGNRYVFALQPTLTFTSTNASKFYGQTADVSSNFSTSSNVSAVANAFTVDTGSYTGTPTLTSTGAASTATVAGGPYTINIAQGSVTSDYALNFVSSGNLTVNKSTLIIYAGSQNKTYGQTYSSTTAFTTSGLQNSDTVTAVDLASAGAAATADAGNYTLTASNAVGTGLSNYNVSYSAGTLQVGKAVLTITASNTSKQYGLTHTFAGTEFNSSGLVNGDTISGVTLTSAGAAATANVAGYQINVSDAAGAKISNYLIFYNNGSMSVTRAPLTVQATDQTKVYGTAHNLGTTAFSITSGALVNSDTLTGVTLTSGAAAATANVGFQSIIPSAATGTGLSNYTITYSAAGRLTVTPAPLTITATDRTKSYGTVLGSSGPYTITDGALFNGDTLTSVSLASAGFAQSATVAGGPYAINASNAQGTGLYNYTITYAPGVLTVAQANLTVTANNQTKNYGDALSLGTTGFTNGQMFNGDTIGSVTLTSAGAAATGSAGTHAIVASNAQGSGLANYNITYVDGSLSVAKATLIVYVGTANKIYGETASLTNQYSVTGLKNADGVMSVDLSSAGAAATASVGNYALDGANAQGSGLGNYNISYQAGSLSVSPASLTITANNLSKVYGTAHTFAGTEFGATGLVNGDTIGSVNLASTGAAATANVGGYQVAVSGATGSGLSNYSIYYNNGSMSVTQAPITITANDQTKTYGTAFNLGTTEFSITSGSLFNSDTLTGVTLTSGAAAATAAAGWQSITPSSATGTGLSNYAITYSTTGRLTVTPAPLTVTIDNRTKTYGQALSLGTTGYTLTGDLFNGDTLTGVTLTSAGAFQSAQVSGSPYAITGSNPTGTGLYNYAITYVSGGLTVTPANITITANNQSKTYGNTHTLGTTAYSVTGNMFNGDNVTGVSLASAGVDATATVAGGPYAITGSNAQGSGLANYSITYADGSLTVNPASLVIYAGSMSKTYGTTYSFTNQYTTSGLKNSDAVSSVDLTSAGAAGTANVGNYAVTGSNAQGTGLSNYTVSYQPGSMNVSPAVLTVTGTNTSKVYGSTHSFAGTEFTSSGLVNGDTISAVTIVSAGAAATANVGGYTATVSDATGSGLGNYVIYYNASSLSVTPAPLTVTATNQSKVYGSTASLGTTGFTTTGTLYNGDAVTGVSLTSPGGAPATANVAGYSLFAGGATGTGVSNYSITYVAGTLQVTPAPLTVTANDRSKTYGDALSLGTTEFAVTGTLYNGNTLTGVSLASAGAAANAPVNSGAYPIIASNATGTGLSNYAITYVAGTLAVDRANLTITANDASKGYGQTLTFNGSEFTPAGLKNGETIGSVLLSSAGAAAGANVNGSPYAINASNAAGGTFAANNYNITYVAGTLTVTPAALTVSITPNAATKTYGDAFTFNGTEFTPVGLTNGDTISGVTLTSAGAVATAAAGQYDIASSNAMFSSGSALNYNIVYNVLTNGLTVTPRALIITANSASRVYGDANSSTGTAIGDNLVNGDTITGVTLNTPATVASGVGTYNLSGSAATGTGLSNYAITYATVANGLTVTPRALIVTANAVSRIYGDANPVSGTATGDNLVNGDTIAGVSLSSPATTASGVGGYDLTGSAATGTGLSNYAITYATVANGLTVTPRALIVTANGVSRIYGDANPASGTATGNNLVNGDTIAGVTLNTPATTASGVGGYDLTGSAATGTGLGNYTITYATVANGLTVTPRALVITANNVSRVYGDANPASGGATGNNLVNGDTITGVTLNTAATLASGIGGYDLTGSAATGTGLSNYAITYATVANGLTITPRALIVTANAASRIYGDANPATGTATGDNLVNGDAITGVSLSSPATAASAVGGYDLTGSAAIGTGLGNYAITYATVANGLTVTPRALIVTANAASRVYGDANPATGTATGDNLVNGDTIAGVTLNTPAIAASGVGSYSLTGSAATGSGLGNYTITYATVANGLTVTPRALIVTANGVSRIYGDANPATGSATGDNLVNGDVLAGVTLNTPATAASGVGSYALTGSAATGTRLGNYTITYATVTNGLTVTPRALIVTANAVSRIYGDANPASGSATGDNLVNGDTIAGVTLNTPATLASGIGGYDLTGAVATGTGLGNYAITYATVANGLTVTPRALIVTANGVSRIYGDANPASGGATGDNLVNGDAITGVTLNTPATTASSIGGYDLTGSSATGTGLGNYTITYATVANGLTVTPRALIVTANGVSRVYGDANPASGGATGDNLVNGDAITGVSLTSPATTADGIGGYDLTGSSATGTGLSNYTITYATVANGLTVTPRALIVTADAQSKLVGDADPLLSYRITSGNLVNSDTLIGALTRDPGETEGAYAILQGSLAASANYSLAYVGADLTIAVPPPAPVNNGDYATSWYNAAPPGGGVPVVNISFQPNAPGAPVISVVNAPNVAANPPANTNVAAADPAQTIAPAGGPLDLFVPISQFDRTQYVADALPGFAPDASQATVLAMIARAGLNNRVEPKIDALWSNGSASWPDANGAIGRTAQFGDGSGTSRQPAGDNGFTFVNGTTDVAALLRSGPVMLGGVKTDGTSTPWLLALQMTADGKGIIANDPATGSQVVLAYDPATKTVGGVTGIVDPATRQIAPLGDTAPAGIAIPAAAWNTLKAFSPASFFAVSL
jgi:filamentous hemagglutinin family protein